MNKPIIYDIKSLIKTVNDGMSQKHILNDITLKIEQGDFLGIAGDSGSGKSTLLQILAGFDNFDKGTMIFNGKPISNSKQSSILLENIGFVFQSFYLINHYDVYDNIALPLRIIGKLNEDKIELEVEKTMEKVKISLNKKFQTIKTLSGGEKQRVAIARAIVKSPKILMADEATGNLDKENEKNIMNLFKELNDIEKITILIVTHNKDLLTFCNKTIELIDGKVLVRGKQE